MSEFVTLAALAAEEEVAMLRGKLTQLDAATVFLATVHPSFLLRLREEADKREEWARFLGDLGVAAQWARAGSM